MFGLLLALRELLKKGFKLILGRTAAILNSVVSTFVKPGSIIYTD